MSRIAAASAMSGGLPAKTPPDSDPEPQREVYDRQNRDDRDRRRPAEEEAHHQQDGAAHGDGERRDPGQELPRPELDDEVLLARPEGHAMQRRRPDQEGGGQGGRAQ